MTLEAFEQIVSFLKKDSDRLSKLYKLGIDLYNLQDDLHHVISITLKSHYSEEGEDIISWWVWEDGDKTITYQDGTTRDINKMEDVWKYIEEIRTSPDFKEYVPSKKKKMTKKQMKKLFEKMFV